MPQCADNDIQTYSNLSNNTFTHGHSSLTEMTIVERKTNTKQR
jgi:hypothetical protein